MSKHEDLIEVLRCIGSAICNEAADALEAQAREIEGLHAARRAYASEFPPDNEGEPDVGSIHQNIRAMKKEIEGLRKDAEELRFIESDLMYWVDRAVSKGNANLDIEEAYERYEQWLAARNEGAPHG